MCEATIYELVVDSRKMVGLQRGYLERCGKEDGEAGKVRRGRSIFESDVMKETDGVGFLTFSNWVWCKRFIRYGFGP